VQTAADNAAYSAATWNARYMNQMAYLNRAIVANYDSIATLTGVWSFLDGLDGFVGLIRTLLRVFFDIGDAITPVAKILHTANDKFADFVIGGGKKNKRVGSYLENYSNVLSFAQQGLYIANQIGRGRVVQTIAWGVDPKIEYWLPSEIWGIQEIANRRDWKKSDEQKGLRLTLERSLNELANGNSFRDLDNFPFIGTLVDIVNLIPCFEITIGPEGFDGPGFDHVSGAVGGAGKVKIIEPKRIYQNDFSGLKIEFDCIVSFTLIEFGHNRDDKRNLPNAINLAVPHIVDEEGDHGEFIKRNVDCNSASGPGASDLDLGNKQDPKLQKDLEAQKLCGTGSDPFRAVDVDKNNEDLPPGPVKGSGLGGFSEPFTIDRVAAEKKRVEINQARAKENPAKPPIPSSAIDDDRSCFEIQKAVEAEQDGKRVEGPSVFVFLRKKAGVLPLFKGLGLRDDFNIEAYAFGRAYYTQRPNAGSSEKETAFNPFWAGRLEKAPIFFH
jgi:hypothetical protein